MRPVLHYSFWVMFVSFLFFFPSFTTEFASECYWAPSHKDLDNEKKIIVIKTWIDLGMLLKNRHITGNQHSAGWNTRIHKIMLFMFYFILCKQYSITIATYCSVCFILPSCHCVLFLSSRRFSDCRGIHLNASFRKDKHLKMFCLVVRVVKTYFLPQKSNTACFVLLEQAHILWPYEGHSIIYNNC